MFKKSVIEETIIYRLIWEFFTNTISYIYLFLLFIYFYYQTGKIPDHFFLMILLAGILLQWIGCVINAHVLKFIANMAPFALLYVSLRLDGHNYLDLLQNFLLIFFIFSLANSLLQEMLITSSSMQRSLSFIMVQIARFLALASNTIIIQAELPFPVKIDLSFAATTHETSIAAIYFVLNLLVISMSFFAIMIMLISRNTNLELFSRRLKNLSSWSLDSDVIERTLSRDEIYLNHELRTTMFGDIRGFSSYCEDNNISQVVEVIETFYSMVEETIKKHGGYKPEFIADEFISFFDSNEKAVEAALELSENINNFLEDYGLGMGIGIDRGPVLEGIVGGSGSKKYTVIGRSVNIAARLQAQAEARQILVTKRVVEKIKGLRMTEITGMKLKGVNRKFMIYSIYGHRQQRKKANKLTQISRNLKQKLPFFKR